jgi:DNA-binding FadR family transcriptional regulator
MPMLDRAASRAGATQLREFILQGIAAGSLPPGVRLPTEREFVERFAVARSAVRRTLATLEADGRIARFVGRGTFVVDPVRAARVEGPVDASPADLMEARLLIEPTLADLVVKQATGADFERMESSLGRAEAATTVEAFEIEDNALHEAIVAATHNQFLIGIYERVALLRRRAEWGKLKERSLTPQRRLAYQREHRLIVAALRARDPPAARTAMLDHLRHVCRNMFEE